MDSLATMEYLESMGFDPVAVRLALQKHNNDTAKAVAHLLGDPVPEDDGPPPLIAVEDDEPPPYGPPNNEGGNDKPRSEAWAVAPYIKPNTSTIDLTGEDDEAPPLVSVSSREDDDLKRAIALSVGGGMIDDDEVTKAMAASVLTQGSADLASAGWPADGDAQGDQVAPEKRVREADQVVLLRSTSVHLSLLSAYLQSIYAVPSWRNAILGFRPSEDEIPGYIPALGPRRSWVEMRLYKDYWKGEPETVLRSDNIGLAHEERERLFAVQRLFAIMTHTKRAFVHTSDVEAAFKIDQKQFRWSGSQDVITAFHHSLTLAFTTCERERLQIMMSEGALTQDEFDLELKRSVRVFSMHGRVVENNTFLPGPLPPLSAEDLETASTDLFTIQVETTSSRPDTLYAALDRNLNGPDDSTFSMLTSLSDVIAFAFSRDSTNSSGLAEKQLFEVPRTLFLDRYASKKRNVIQERRARMAEQRTEAAAYRDAARELAVTEDGQDALLLVKTTLEYCQQATSSDPVRAARQKKLAATYEQIYEDILTRSTLFAGEGAKKEKEADELFDTDDMRQMGYNLCSLVMRNGLNGRGSAWSYVVDERGQWWKVIDDKQTKVEFDDISKDKSGLFLDAGVFMAFYQLDSSHTELARPLLDSLEGPPFLKRCVLIDNTSFASDLPNDLSADWELVVPTSPSPSPPDDPAPDPIAVDLDPYLDSDIDGTPLDSLPMSAADSLPEPWVNEEVQPIEIEAERAWSDVPSAPMSDIQVATPSTEDEDPMRLRGGGQESDEEEGSEDEYDGEDEDEVELGCLREMPDEWDIDVALGKVGGLPRWLDPTSPLQHQQVACGVCGNSMSLLLQLNSPDDQRQHAAARTLYVFACRRKDCRSTAEGKTIRVWRVQLPSPNAFYPHTLESQARRKALEDALDPTSKLAGQGSTGAKPLVPLPEWDIECESEPYEESFLTDSTRPHEDDGGQGEDAAEPDTATGVDKAFLIFQERVERVPEQVLRFYRLPGVEEPEPLWVSSKRIAPSDIPACPLCGAARKIEFQVLSTVLAVLKEDDFHFDSILVYTCVDNCELPAPAVGDGAGWAEEHVEELSFAVDGVNFGGPP